MSQENVEIVRAAVEAWNAGDMDSFRELHDPDVIWRQPEGWPEPGPEVGREAVMHQLGQQRETWDADALELASVRFGEIGQACVSLGLQVSAAALLDWKCGLP